MTHFFSGLIHSPTKRADNEIARRDSALNALVARINQTKHLKSSDKNSFITSIQSEINSLNFLKTKINADTDLNTLKTEVQSIVTDYRVFLLFIPKIHLLTAADRVTNIAGKLNDLAAKLQTRISEAKTKGKDVTTLQITLNDTVTKIADANTQYTNVESSIITLTPTGYPGNKGILMAARTMIQTGHNDLVKALQDSKLIIKELKSLGGSSTSSATSQ